MVIPGTDTLEPCYLFRFFVIRRPHKVAHGGAGCREDPLKFNGSDDIWISCVAIGLKTGRIKRLKTRGQNNRAHTYLNGLALLSMGFKSNGLGTASIDTLKTFAAVPTVQASISLFFSCFFFIA